MDLKTLVATKRAAIESKLTARKVHTDAIALVRAAITDARDLTAEETATVTTADQARSTIDSEIEVMRAALAPFEAELALDEAAQRLQSEITPTGNRAAAHGGAQITGEARTYTKEADPQGRNFLADVTLDYLGNRGARERLSRHESEERVERGDQLERAVTAAGSPGLVVPQYLTDLYAPKARAGRPFADQCRHHDLPATGMTVYIPRQTAKTSVDLQAAEMDTVAEADYDNELISIPVRTAAGSQTISRQAVERSLGTEDIVFEDLLRAFSSDLDNKLINAPGWGLSAVANVLAWTEAAPTAELLFPKIMQASANIEDVLLDLDEKDVFVLTRGRRWKWIQAALTEKHLLISQGGGDHVGSGNGSAYAAGIRGQLPDGTDVVTDNNITTIAGGSPGTQDEMFVVARQEAHLWEDPNAPMFIRAEQPQAKKLGIDLVLYGYYAAIFNRVVDDQGSPKPPHQKITGTGLVPAVFGA